jgi:hypothetical protein
MKKLNKILQDYERQESTTIANIPQFVHVPLPKNKDKDPKSVSKFYKDIDSELR